MARQQKKITKKLGRPATGVNPMIGVRMQATLLKKVEDWRAAQRPIPSVPEAIRRLVEQALSKTK